MSELDMQLFSAVPGSDELAQNLLRLPAEVREMIYKDVWSTPNHRRSPFEKGCRPHYGRDDRDLIKPGFGAPPQVLWLSPQISKEVQTSKSLEGAQWNLHVRFCYNQGRIHFDRLDCWETLSWLGAGLGEATSLDLLSRKGGSGGNFTLRVSYNSREQIAVSLSPLGRSEYPWVNENRDGEIVEMFMLPIFRAQLAAEVQSSIRRREGYGVSMTELDIIVNALDQFSVTSPAKSRPWLTVKASSSSAWSIEPVKETPSAAALRQSGRQKRAGKDSQVRNSEPSIQKTLKGKSRASRTPQRVEKRPARRSTRDEMRQRHLRKAMLNCEDLEVYLKPKSPTLDDLLDDVDAIEDLDDLDLL